MRVDPHANLTITLIRRNEFGWLRFVGRPGRPGAPASQIAAAHRCRLVPRPTSAADHGCAPKCLQPAPFPYDTPLPVGLPDLRDEPPAPAPIKTIHRVRPLPPITDQIGRMVDLYV